jgi:glutamine synthetase
MVEIPVTPADFVQHYAAMKRFEAEKYRQQLSEWEVRRYAEMA